MEDLELSKIDTNDSIFDTTQLTSINFEAIQVYINTLKNTVEELQQRVAVLESNQQNS